MDARIDAHLSRLVSMGKIFVGQKLRICGASLAEDASPPHLHLKVASSSHLHDLIPLGCVSLSLFFLGCNPDHPRWF